MGKKRLIVCITLVVCVLACAVASLFALKKTGEEFCERIDTCLQACTDGKTDLDSLEGELESIEEYWSEYYAKASFLTRSAALDEIAASVARLRPLITADCDEFSSELSALRYRVYMLYENQLPHLRSIF